jgi:phytoene dehydrogenase-like protein
MSQTVNPARQLLEPSEEDTMPEEPDVVVVGGGIAGLAAATTAARHGSKVVLVDAHHLGGRAQSDHRRGFTFNRGPHALYDRGAARAALKGLGVPVSGSPAPLVGAKALRAGKLFSLPTSPASLIRCDLLTPLDRVSFGRILTSLPRRSTRALVAMSAREWCDRVTRRPSVTGLLQALVRLSTYASDLDALSADAAVAQLRLSTGGVTYLDGGWQSIVDGLEHAARDSGVVISSGNAVSEVEVGPKRVAVAVGEGEVIGRTVVLAAGSPDVTARLLPGSVPEDLGPPVQATCVDYGLSTPPPESFILGIDEPVYLSLHAPNARLAPPGGAVLCAMSYGSAGTESVERLDELSALAGADRSTILERRVLSSMTVAHAMPKPGSGLPGRPGISVFGTDNCFVAGDWVGEDGLLGDAALASGVAAGRAAALR